MTSGFKSKKSGNMLPLSEHPLVSVISTSYNMEQFLKPTIDSVLTQDYENFEIIIVDGASTDKSIDILQTYAGDPRVRWISEEDSGPVEATNKGFSMAHGELVGILPISDLYLPGAIGALVEEFTSDSRLALVGGWNRLIDATGHPTGHQTILRNERYDYSLETIITLDRFPRAQASLYRRDLVIGIGGLDERKKTSHGEFLLRYALEAARQGGTIRAIPEVLASYRAHESQRHSSDAHAGVLHFVDQRRAYIESAQAYQDILTPRQARIMRKTGYRHELRYRAHHIRHLPGALAAAWGYARNGGMSHLLRRSVPSLVSTLRR